MTTVDDIAAAVIGRLEGSAAVAVALPGGCWNGRADEQSAGAYAVFALEREGEPEWYSDGTYTASYVLRVAAYTAQEAGDPTAVQRALADALSTSVTEWGELESGRVLHCLPRGYDGRFSPVLRSARDVFVSGAQWALLIEGDTEP